MDIEVWDSYARVDDPMYYHHVISDIISFVFYSKLSLFKMVVFFSNLFILSCNVLFSLCSKILVENFRLCFGG